MTVAKYLLRLPTPLKHRATAAAAAAHMSLNTFIIKALENACPTPGRTPSSVSPLSPSASFSSSSPQPSTATTPTTGPPPIVFRTPA